MKSVPGFTLIELLVVISIIGLLSSVVLVSLNAARMKSRDAQRKANLTQLSKALELYYSDNNQYPTTDGTWWGECANGGSHGLTGSSAWIPNLAPQYLTKLPHDPSTGAGTCGTPAWACYIYYSDGKNYKIMAHCLAETGYPANDPFYDPVRPGWSWQVSTPGGVSW